jgi:hypothetical protein
MHTVTVALSPTLSSNAEHFRCATATAIKQQQSKNNNIFFFSIFEIFFSVERTVETVWP